MMKGMTPMTPMMVMNGMPMMVPMPSPPPVNVSPTCSAPSCLKIKNRKCLKKRRRKKKNKGGRKI